MRALLVGFLLTGGLTLLASVLGLLRVEAGMAGLDFHAEGVQAAQDLHVQLSEAVQESLAYAVSGSPGERREHERRLARFDAGIAQLRRHGLTPALRPALEHVLDGKQAVMSSSARLMEEFDRSGRVSARTFEEHEAAVDDAIQRVDALLALERARMDEAQRLARRLVTQSQWLLGGVGILALTLALSLGTYLSRQLAREFEARRREETRRREIEELYRHSQKMEAVGQLAGGVAHDFNNQLTIIQGGVELLRTSAGREDAHLEDIEEAVERSAALTQQLLAFGRKQVLQPRVTELNDVVRGLAPMLERTLGEQVALVLRCAEVAPVLADRTHIEHALINLALNARDAMPGGGTLTIETGMAGDPEDEPEVMLAVVDTGVGLDDETKDRVFEPFFTTKPSGKGTGLGLSSVFGIVSQHGGRVLVRSEPGEGARFELRLPRAELGTVPDGALGSEASTGGRGTVLLVEDEPGVRRVTQRALEQSGYRVRVATDGQDAWERFADEPFDLLITDLRMPRLGGIELARRMHERRPDLAVLYITGYAAEEQEGLVGRDLLPKPYSMQTLVRRAGEALDVNAARKTSPA